LKSGKDSIALTLNIELHEDEKPMLENIRNILGAGNLIIIPKKILLTYVLVLDTYKQ